MHETTLKALARRCNFLRQSITELSSELYELERIMRMERNTKDDEWYDRQKAVSLAEIFIPTS